MLLLVFDVYLCVVLCWTHTYALKVVDFHREKLLVKFHDEYKLSGKVLCKLSENSSDFCKSYLRVRVPACVCQYVHVVREKPRWLVSII